MSYVEQFLEQKPAFALMISGEWGVGKTFLVKSLFQTRSDYLYVSVNGTTKAADIVERLYLSAFPLLADKTMRALGSIARTVAGALRIKSDLSAEDLLGLDRYNVLIFDDLERSLMTAEELLGFINNFVEHDSKHVILISNEGELAKRENYVAIREKVVGFTLEARPEFDSALINFRASLPASYAAFIERSHDDLIAVMKEAGWKNIRVAKYVLNEFLEVFDTIETASISSDDASAMFRTFFVLDYAYKTGLIGRPDIVERNVDDFARAFLRHQDKHIATPLEKLNDTHPSVDVFSSNFDNEYLELKICDGFHDVEKLSRSLGDISGRADSSKNPEWRNLWYLIHHEDETIQESFDRMMAKFQARDYDDAGVILHVFGLLHRMREAQLLPWTLKRLVRECKKFIVDKSDDGSLPILAGDYLTGLRHGAAHGLGFTAISEPSFQEVTDFYRVKSRALQTSKVLQEINDIIDAPQFDLEAFRGIILQGARDDSIYNQPLLQMTDARRFADSVMKEPASQQFSILSALGSRYDGSPFPEVRVTEAPWLRALILALRRVTKRLPATTRFRIDEIIKWNLAEPATPDQDGSEGVRVE